MIAEALAWCLAAGLAAAFLARWYGGSWGGKTSSVYLIVQPGRSSSFPSDQEHHLFMILASRSLSGQKPLHAKAGQSFAVLVFMVQRAANPLGN